MGLRKLFFSRYHLTSSWEVATYLFWVAQSRAKSSVTKSRNKPILTRNGRNLPDLGRNGRNIPDLSRNARNITPRPRHGRAGRVGPGDC